MKFTTTKLASAWVACGLLLFCGCNPIETKTVEAPTVGYNNVGLPAKVMDWFSLRSTNSFFYLKIDKRSSSTNVIQILFTDKKVISDFLHFLEAGDFGMSTYDLTPIDPYSILKGAFGRPFPAPVVASGFIVNGTIVDVLEYKTNSIVLFYKQR